MKNPKTRPVRLTSQKLKTKPSNHKRTLPPALGPQLHHNVAATPRFLFASCLLLPCSPTSPYPSLTEMETQLVTITNNTEPYCAIFNKCYKSAFKREDCRPLTCPFRNVGACRYVGACLQSKVVEEYKKVVETSIKDGAVVVVEGEEKGEEGHTSSVPSTKHHPRRLSYVEMNARRAWTVPIVLMGMYPVH